MIMQGMSLSDEQSNIIKSKAQNAKSKGSMSANVGNIKQVTEQQRQQNGSNFVPVVSDGNISKLLDICPLN